MSVFVYMGIVRHDGDIVGHFIPWSMGKLYLNMWLVSSDMLWTFTNTTTYKLILGGFVGVVVLDYYQRKERFKMDCRACEGDCVIVAV